MRLLHRVAALGALMLTTACTNITPVEQQYSGFLENYDDLTPVRTGDGADAMRWYTPTLADRRYTKLIVEPIRFYPEPQTSDQVSADRLTQLSDYMTRSLRRELAKEFELVTEPSADAAVVSFALTGVDTPTEGLKARNLIPASLLIAGATYAAGERDHIVVVYIEGQLTDAATGETLAKGVRQGRGGRLRNDTDELAVEDVQAYLDGWAGDIAALATQLKGR